MQKKTDASERQFEANLVPDCSQINSVLHSINDQQMLKRRMSALLGRFSRGRSAMALADQVMISGSNFLTNIVLVRGLGLSEYGKYSIAYVLLLYANALQMSFVASPMLSIAPLMSGKEKRQFVSGMLAVQLLASLLVFAVFALAGAALHIFTTFYSLPCIFAFAFCVGTFQLQDWLRRYYFLYNKGKFAIGSDFISYFVQLVLLFILWRAGHLTLFRTFQVMCITSVAALVMGPITDRLRPEIKHLRETWARCKSLSRDLLIANQVRWFGVQGVLLIGTGIVGTAAAGGLRATLSLAGPVNLVLTSIENVIPIRIAEELKRTGAKGAYVLTRRTIVGGTVLFSLLLVPVGIFGRPILRILYGPAMMAFYVPMLLQLGSIVVQIASNLWVYFYRGVRDTRALLRGNALSAITSIATVYLFGRLWQAPGIVLASLLGMASAVMYFMLHWVRHREELVLRYPTGSLFTPAATVAVSDVESAEIDLVPDGRAE
jgi:O-antigen/teichoic acid export membrane protein